MRNRYNRPGDHGRDPRYDENRYEDESAWEQNHSDPDRYGPGYGYRPDRKRYPQEEYDHRERGSSRPDLDVLAERYGSVYDRGSNRYGSNYDIRREEGRRTAVPSYERDYQDYDRESYDRHESDRDAWERDRSYRANHRGESYDRGYSRDDFPDRSTRDVWESRSDRDRATYPDLPRTGVGERWEPNERSGEREYGSYDRSPRHRDEEPRGVDPSEPYWTTPRWGRADVERMDRHEEDHDEHQRGPYRRRR